MKWKVETQNYFNALHTLTTHSWCVSATICAEIMRRSRTRTYDIGLFTWHTQCKQSHEFEYNRPVCCPNRSPFTIFFFVNSMGDEAERKISSALQFDHSNSQIAYSYSHFVVSFTLVAIAHHRAIQGVRNFWQWHSVQCSLLVDYFITCRYCFLCRLLFLFWGDAICHQKLYLADITTPNVVPCIFRQLAVARSARLS